MEEADTVEQVHQSVSGWGAEQCTSADPRHPSVLEQKYRAADKAHQAALTNAIEAPDSPDDVIARVCQVIDAVSVEGRSGLGRQLVAAFGGTFELKRDGRLKRRRQGFAEVPGLNLARGLTLHDLMVWAPDLAKATTTAAIHSHQYAPGPADRASVIAELEREKANNQRLHTAVVAAAAALTPPIIFKYLPAEQQRRDAEASKALREATATAARQRAENIFNQQSDAATAGRSRYLEDQSITRP